MGSFASHSVFQIPLLCVVLWIAGPAAQAQRGVDAAERVASSAYEVALSEALSAHARGDYAQARIFMERAHQLEPSARTLRGLGIVAFAQGRHLEAIRNLDAALLAREKPLSADLRSSVEELLGHAWARLGRYELVIEPPSGDFSIDGGAPVLYGPSTVVLTPGRHVLSVRAPARAPYELTLNVKAGEQRAVYVVLAASPAPVVGATGAPGQSPPQRAGRDAERAFWTPTKRWVALGVGGGLVLSGMFAWSLAYARLQNVADDCRGEPEGGCTDAEATNAYRRENIEGLAISAGVLLGAGALTLVGVGVVELSRALRRKPPRRAWLLQPGAGSVSFRAHF